MGRLRAPESHVHCEIQPIIRLSMANGCKWFKNKGSGAAKKVNHAMIQLAKACRCKSAMHTKTGDWRNLFSTSCQCSKKFALDPPNKDIEMNDTTK